MFGEGEFVFAIFSARYGERDESNVEAYRIENGEIVESWTPPRAPVRWEWTPTDGKGDTEATREVHRRWYEEMYREGRYFELAPRLCGPVFIRHESTGTFSATAEEHGKRLQEAFGGRSLRLTYRSFAEGDKVGVIGVGDQRFGNWLQTWRVAGSKLVESWSRGTAPGVDWG